MSAKHTPGPWRYSGPNSGEIFGWMGQKQDIPLVIAKVGGYWDGEQEANARLIAAAPDLLEAVEHALRLLDKPRNSVDEEEVCVVLRAAKSKATGVQS